MQKLDLFFQRSRLLQNSKALWRVALAIAVVCICWRLLQAGFVAAQTAEDRIPFAIDQPFTAHDSLNVDDESNADARDCLQGLCWKNSEFSVDCVRSESLRYEVLVRFPTAIPSGKEINDRVAMEWHLARDEQGQPVKAPAIIVVHESGSDMAVGRTIAKMISYQNIHAFMIQLPGYGERRDPKLGSDATKTVTLIRQAIADVRRARDAVAVLPLVDASHIAVQGTSLGGFVSTTAASLDGKFDSVHILLAGGDLYDVIENGEREVAKLRKQLHEAGLSGDKLREVVNVVEPNRIVHRLDPNKTWLYSAIDDQVVPLKNAKLLATKAHLAQSHHILMKADHYSGAIYLPSVVIDLRSAIRQLQESQPDAE
jgi:pimeloyl-ACP methyl ester carboxylesterase